MKGTVMDAPAPPFLTTWTILDQTYRLLFKHFDRQMTRDESSAPMATVLFALKQAGRPIPLSRLARIAVQEAQSITSMADRLEKAGLLRRVPDKRDRRVINVSLTPEGERLTERLSTSAENALAEYLKQLRPRDLETLTKVLQTVRQLSADALQFPLLPFEQLPGEPDAR